MPDITMCTGKNVNNITCPRKDTCYRYTATPSQYRQSYFVTAPLIDNKTAGTVECDYHYKIDWVKGAWDE